MRNNIQNILDSLPHSPGIYQFFNAKKEIIYVGKSKNLKSRVGSYFSDPQKLNFAKKQMLVFIVDIRYIVTNNETESLILENDLIKKHAPKYNILLKDDKNFLYIKITKESYPKILRTRISPSSIKKSDGKYFGPYISGYHVFQIFKLLKKIFGYGAGKHNFFMKQRAYNLDKYIFPGNISGDEAKIYALYHEKIKEIEQFLSGKTQKIKERLTQEMEQKAKNLEFEEAQKRKLALESLTSLEQSQFVRDGVKGNYFVIQVITKYERNFLGAIEIVEGKIAGYENIELENSLSEEENELFRDIIEKKWIESPYRETLGFIVPKHIYGIHSDITIEIPEIGAKYELLKLCYKNIYEYAHKRYIDSLSVKQFSKSTMEELLKILGYTQMNEDIIFECNDISHLSGNHSVASRSIIENGKKNTKKYKKFRIKTLDEGKIDDFGSMREIMIRRLKELQKIGNYPDLIVIDGGKGQLGAVMQTIKEYSAAQRDGEENPLDPSKIQIVSIAKREEELFLPSESKPILLKKDSAELRLIQALRDEAHRFAISFNRDSRTRAQKKNILEAIPGIGPKTRKKILTQFGSVGELKNHSRSEIEKYIGPSITEILEIHGII